MIDKIFTMENLPGLLGGGVVILLCIILGIILFSGHGLMLISGFNTMRPEERKKINGKAMGKVVGVYMLFTALFLALMIVFGILEMIYQITAGIVLYMAMTIVMVVYLNKSSRFKKSK